MLGTKRDVNTELRDGVLDFVCCKGGGNRFESGRNVRDSRPNAPVVPPALTPLLVGLERCKLCEHGGKRLVERLLDGS